MPLRTARQATALSEAALLTGTTLSGPATATGLQVLTSGPGGALVVQPKDSETQPFTTEPQLAVLASKDRNGRV